MGKTAPGCCCGVETETEKSVILKPSEAESRALTLLNLEDIGAYYATVVCDAGRDLLRLVSLVRSSSSQ